MIVKAGPDPSSKRTSCTSLHPGDMHLYAFEKPAKFKGVIFRAREKKGILSQKAMRCICFGGLTL